jgi:hypothetical protein
MLKSFSHFFVSLFLFVMSFQLNGEIVQTNTMKELYDHLQPGMLIVFDIDNTIIEPKQTLGSDQWFHHRMDEYKSYGYSDSNSLEFALREWMAIQNLTEVQLVENDTGSIITDLQHKGYDVIGLTTRGLGMSTRTIHQLQSVGVSLQVTAPSKDEFHFMNGRGVLYHEGILFTAATDKGEALRKYINTIGYIPKSVMFINDKYSHIVPVAEFCEGANIPFIGLRYAYLDEKVANFPRQVALVQFYNFGRILTDEAAKRFIMEPAKN